MTMESTVPSTEAIDNLPRYPLDPLTGAEIETAAAVISDSQYATPTLKFVIKDSPCYIGLNKEEPQLLAKVNEIITQAKASGELGKLSEKWLKAPLPPGF